WMEMYERIVAYKREHNGTTDGIFSQKYDEQLRIWVSNQRASYIKKRLRDDRISLLDTIGFDWKVVSFAITSAEKWMGMFQKLVAYKEQHENTKVPRRYAADPSFGHWVAYQRSIFRHNKMRDDRITLLNGIDFDWGRRGLRPRVSWITMYERLVVYKREHNGSINGIFSLECNEQLGLWVLSQRTAYKNKRLSDEQISLLDNIALDWN
ncbi:hypothetical protein FRACYDRAFT_150426, partial [Fragilariopsis cylindrus CCMP1102]